MYQNKSFISPEKFSDSMQACGYSLAQLHYAFVQWAAQKAQYPVKVALRDGAPIIHTANWLNKKKLANLKDWSPVWLNIPTAKLFFEKPPTEEIVRCFKQSVKEFGNTANHRYFAKFILDDKPRKQAVKYFKQEGLDKPFTYVDVGYKGNISNVFDKNQPKKLQTLFMAGSERFFNSENKRRAFLNEIKFHEQLFSALPNGIKEIKDYGDFCEKIFENGPKETKSHEDSYFGNGYQRLYKKVKGTLQPDLISSPQPEIDAYNNYINGLTKGLEDCSKVQQDADNKKQFKKYLNELFLAVPSISHIFNSSENCREDYDNKIPFFDKTACDELSRQRDKIERIYRG